VASFRTRDSNEAWAAAEGLFSIQDGFKAPGYAPAQVVGSITYSIPSPPRTGSRAIRGRQLFTDAALHLRGAPSLPLQDADVRIYEELRHCRCRILVMCIYEVKALWKRVFVL
jgi:hypothetical protein